MNIIGSLKKYKIMYRPIATNIWCYRFKQPVAYINGIILKKKRLPIDM